VAGDMSAPGFSVPTYAVRGPLYRWLESEAPRSAGARLLDVGSGVKPYLPLFEPYVREYVGVDVANPAADLAGSVEALPVPDASFDVVLCTQVLEHCDDPAQAVRELRRVTAPGGRVLASTHGVYVYHPSPHDLWRWTHEGLERLFSTNANWRSVTVRASSGTTACVAMLLSVYLEHLSRRTSARALGRIVTAGLNAAAQAIDERFTRLRDPGLGTIHANYHVTAVAP